MAPSTFLWVSALISGIGIGLFLFVRFFSRLRRHLYCPWCWKALHLMQWYPSRWSSTICAYHARQVLLVHARRRQQKRALALAAPTPADVGEQQQVRAAS